MAENDLIAIDIPGESVADFCRRYQVTRLALFGSVLSQRFGPDSDVDVLVTFDPTAQVGFLKLSRMQRELSELLGRPVDLVPQSGLKSLIRDDVIAESRVTYAA